jgi:hypothetical protein
VPSIHRVTRGVLLFQTREELGENPGNYPESSEVEADDTRTYRTRHERVFLGVARRRRER